MSVYFKSTIENHLAIAVTELSHADEIFELLYNDQENIGHFLGFVALTKTKEDEVNYIKKKMHGIADGTDALFSIIRDNHIVGVIDLHYIDSENKEAEIGYWLHSKFQHQGIMTKSVRKICEYAFENIGLNKLSLFADVENIGSNAVAKHAGFSYLATHPDYYVHRGQLRDMNEYYLLKREF